MSDHVHDHDMLQLAQTQTDRKGPGVFWLTQLTEQEVGSCTAHDTSAQDPHTCIDHDFVSEWKPNCLQRRICRMGRVDRLLPSPDV